VVSEACAGEFQRIGVKFEKRDEELSINIDKELALVDDDEDEG
jgi:hypothetical protein